MTFTLAVLPLALLIIGAPIFVIFLAGAVAALIFVLQMPPLVIQQVMFGALDNYALLAVPFFLFAGEVMSRSGMADRLIVFVQTLMGRMPGSLGLTVVGTGTVLGAISGSSPATVAAVGKTLYPSLVRDNYPPHAAAGLIASSASVAIIIPPSIAMILYGAAAEQSIPRLFVAGIVPGLLLASLMALVVVIMARRRHGSSGRAFDLAAAVAAMWSAGGALLLPVFVLGGIMLGWFSPTEAGGFACTYAILLARWGYRSLSWTQLLDCAAEAALLTAQILIIVATAGLFTYLLATQQVPQQIVQWVSSLGLGPLSFLLAVNILLLMVGCLLDPTSAILVLTPMLMPLVTAFGIDPVHFGVVMVVNVSIGMFTPPFGLNVFVAQSTMNLPLKEIYWGVLPFAAIQIFGLLIITYFPQLSLSLTAHM